LLCPYGVCGAGTASSVNTLSTRSATAFTELKKMNLGSS
jgi:hypothetical protein